ncbi:hypothetical protein I3843_15G075900 [Carya illinoinensis]|nr:hypothetical protein I3843_15G075900 [Carya illinoinensis]
MELSRPGALQAGERSRSIEEGRGRKSKAAHYTLLEGVLYKRSYSMPLLRCISFEEAQSMLAEVQVGISGNHSGGKTLAGKMMRVGCYWPYALQDTEEYV